MRVVGFVPFFDGHRGSRDEDPEFRRNPLKVTLPDGHVLELAEGAATYDVAIAIGAGLARAAIAGKVTCNGQSEIIDLNRPLPGDCQISILTTDDSNADSLYVLRHSTAHVMAEAICKLFPDAQLVYGPPVEDGFYYDIDLSQSLTPDDFPRIEEEMSRIIKEKRTFCRVEMSREEGMAKVRKEGSRYKIDNAERAEGDVLSFYVTGDRPGEHFEDLCRGPHVRSTKIIKAFKIRQVSRSHYRGDVNDQPLQRVYGTAFFKKSLSFGDFHATRVGPKTRPSRDRQGTRPVPHERPSRQRFAALVTQGNNCQNRASKIPDRRNAQIGVRSGMHATYRAARVVPHEWSLPLLRGFPVPRDV